MPASSQDVPNKALGFTLKGIDHTHAYLGERGITQQTAETFGAGFFGGKGSMAGRIVIPIHNEAGELVAYAGRSIDSTEPRYKLPAGFHKAAELYNLHRATQAGEHRLILVEGFFDCMKVSQAGYPFVVALMGSSLSQEQERLLVKSADQVLLMLDGDEAGRRATDEIGSRLQRRVWVKVATVSEGKQPINCPRKNWGSCCRGKTSALKRRVELWGVPLNQKAGDHSVTGLLYYQG